jgi:hypothetical protein
LTTTLCRAGLNLDAGHQSLTKRLVKNLESQGSEAGGKGFPSVAQIVSLQGTIIAASNLALERNTEQFKVYVMNWLGSTIDA